ncbi:hypothetical protein [Sporomusa acidovorans]|nr:hypothetical protein [Sporomusa acidovorans]OZC19065.1 hypothetical protein SPACI_31510 [Sporomusa acidovorans DSM 3132]SDD66181.1 hypothetical protein SAMN04488499_100311 [Sporomusa acidovorans]
MEQHKQDLPTGDNQETYTPWQNLILKLLKWGAWTASAVAMVYAMHY